MINKGLKTALVAAALAGAVSTTAFADEAATPAWGSVTGSVAFTTNYSFRGFSQTQDDPALQGSLQYNAPLGFYAGTWMSNIDFGSSGGRDVGAKLEIDLYGGWTKNFGPWKVDVGGIYYLYPGANDNNTATKVAVVPEVNYYEFYGKVGYDFGIAQVLASVYGSPNNTFKTGGEIYYNGNVTVPLSFLPWNASLSGWVGYQTFLDDVKKGAAVDYLDWSIGGGFTVPYGGIGLDFRYVDTDLRTSGATAQCALNTCKGTFIFTVSKSF